MSPHPTPAPRAPRRRAALALLAALTATLWGGRALSDGIARHLARAVTLGEAVLYFEAEPAMTTWVHEGAHRAQYAADGVLRFATYPIARRTRTALETEAHRAADCVTAVGRVLTADHGTHRNADVRFHQALLEVSADDPYVPSLTSPHPEAARCGRRLAPITGRPPCRWLSTARRTARAVAFAWLRRHGSAPGSIVELAARLERHRAATRPYRALAHERGLSLCEPIAR